MTLPPGFHTCPIPFLFLDLHSDVTENLPAEQEPGAGVRETSLLAGTALPSSLWGAGEGGNREHLPSSGPSSLSLLKTPESRGPEASGCSQKDVRGANRTQPRSPPGTVRIAEEPSPEKLGSRMANQEERKKEKERQTSRTRIYNTRKFNIPGFVLEHKRKRKFQKPPAC